MRRGPMILYSEPDSPFSATVRMAIYLKGLDIEIAAPPGGLLSARFHAINPVGTIPCLMLAADMPLSESAAILEYLEDRFPAVPLLAGTAELRAQTRLLARIAELGVMTPLVRLARRADEPDSAVSQWLTRVVRGLATLNTLLGTRPDGGVTMADCFIAPALFIVAPVARGYGKEALLDAYPVLRRHLERRGDDPHVARVFDELAQGWR